MSHSDERQIESGGFIARMVGAGEVDDAWPACHALIEEACRRGRAEFNAGQLRDDCRSGFRQLWTLRQLGKGIACVAVTTIMDFGGRKTAVWSALGGKNMAAWAHFEIVIAEAARQCGCVAIRGYGRRGWKRRAKGYREIGVIIEREL